jgi:Mg-chelatase subunit ChlD
MQTHESPIAVTILPKTPCAVAQGGDTHLVVELAVIARPVTGARRPLNLAIVLDRSGSMAGGKLDLAKNAAFHLIHRLAVQDRVAVVIYDDDVQLLVPGTAVTADRLPGISMALPPVIPGGSTNLEGGWHAGVRAIAGGMEQMPGAMHRVLLLTDGLANVGITDPGALASLAKGAAAHGIVTIPFGVGIDCDEQLLNAMAEAGAGNAYHIATPERIHAIFREELAELMTVVASGVSVRVTTPPGATAHRRNPVIDATYALPRLTIPVGFVSAGEKPRLVNRVENAPDDLSLGSLALFIRHADEVGADEGFDPIQHLLRQPINRRGAPGAAPLAQEVSERFRAQDRFGRLTAFDTRGERYVCGQCHERV